ncbi:hypothetical protein EG343_05940 [Chryseobacterium nakagawai]|uniref:Uncharacterized protein n=1 Tax=Chryseobacterium nakagawai TaxID=1241982 RepID=A0AAD0YHU7_CHRNA|nr:hypothetical protein EG343_05940 [Chryseobacterium nakagawai]
MREKAIRMVTADHKTLCSFEIFNLDIKKMINAIVIKTMKNSPIFFRNILKRYKKAGGNIFVNKTGECKNILENKIYQNQRQLLF